VRADASAAIAALVDRLPEVEAVGAALVYGAMPDEVDAAPLIAALRARGERIALPRVDGERLTLHWHGEDAPGATGSFGLTEPLPDAPEADPAEIDLVIVPGVAFDAACNRLGMGAGYYDRLLAEMPRAVTVGVAFDEQVVDEVPCEPHDRPLDAVVTPNGVRRRR
jgi:5-formyltetrahydrofolate cyclo-ligase